MVYYWTSAPLIESPMFQLKQVIEMHCVLELFIQDKIESYLIFQFRCGTESDTYKVYYNHTHTWARDLPVCTAEHFFKKQLRFLDPESVQGTTTGIFQWVSKVYQHFLLGGMEELTKFNKVSINAHHPALTALRSFYRD
eukprot:8197909-Pyramimonas_sp.AAC.1